MSLSSSFFFGLLFHFLQKKKKCFSFHQVSKVSDVVSVGQRLSLMCIGQDVRGNIKLSLKATLPQLGSDANNMAEGSGPVMKETPDVWPSVGSESSGQEEQKPVVDELQVSRSVVDDSTSSLPSFLIRTAAECDEEEKSASLSQDSKSDCKGASKTSKTIQASKSGRKKKTKPSQNDNLDVPFLSSGLVSHTQNNLNDKEAAVEAPISAKNLKVGTKVTAKVHQVRALGLVLDLGSGLRGMYRFEVCII